MAMIRTIPNGTSPTERKADLGGKPAKEFSFRVGEVEHVKIIAGVGDKPVAKELPVSLPAGNGFESIRLVINLGMVREADPSQAATVFSPPIELRVRFTQEDLSEAGGRNNLRLAYRQGQNWVPVDFTVEPDNPNDSNSEGYMFATISSWPSDPPVAIGR